MKLTVQASELQNALKLAKGVIITRTPRPILACVKLEARKGLLDVLATDLETYSRQRISANLSIEEEGDSVVPLDKLMGILRHIGKSDIIIIESDGEGVVVRQMNSITKILGYDPDEYPSVPDFQEGKEGFCISHSDLAKMIAKTLFATAKTHSHYAISGVLCEASGKKLQLVATDGHRLAQTKGSLSKAVAKDISAIIPTKLMGIVQQFAPKKSAKGKHRQIFDETFEGPSVSVWLKKQDEEDTADMIFFQFGDIVIKGATIQGNFPPYNNIIPKECSSKAVIDRARFEHSIDQASRSTSEESRGVRMRFKADMVTLSSRSVEAGESEVTCPVSFTGGDLEIAFNPPFLLDALRACESDEITMGMNGYKKPTKFDLGEGFLYVLMPVDLD